MNNKILGAQGEKQAVNYIKRMGYKILATNFTTKIGEIDIIAQDNNYIVFVEVKSRSSLKYGRPSEAVNFHKQSKIKQVALLYLQKNNKMNNFFRFDVLEIFDNEVNYIINAF